MKFKVAPSDEDFPVLRMVSEGGLWEVGYVPVLFGYRVRFGRVGECSVVCDLCCGADAKLRAKVLFYILSTLYAVTEEGMDPKLARQLFPQPSIKPLDLDPIWIEKLTMIESLGPAASVLVNFYV